MKKLNISQKLNTNFKQIKKNILTEIKYEFTKSLIFLIYINFNYKTI